jgi:hypothetical protein
MKSHFTISCGYLPDLNPVTVGTPTALVCVCVCLLSATKSHFTISCGYLPDLNPVTVGTLIALVYVSPVCNEESLHHQLWILARSESCYCGDTHSPCVCLLSAMKSHFTISCGYLPDLNPVTMGTLIALVYVSPVCNNLSAIKSHFTISCGYLPDLNPVTVGTPTALVYVSCLQ